MKIYQFEMLIFLFLSYYFVANENSRPLPPELPYVYDAQDYAEQGSNTCNQGCLVEEVSFLELSH